MVDGRLHAGASELCGPARPPDQTARPPDQTARPPDQTAKPPDQTAGLMPPSVRAARWEEQARCPKHTCCLLTCATRPPGPHPGRGPCVPSLPRLLPVLTPGLGRGAGSGLPCTEGRPPAPIVGVLNHSFILFETTPPPGVSPEIGRGGQGCTFRKLCMKFPGGRRAKDDRGRSRGRGRSHFPHSPAPASLKSCPLCVLLCTKFKCDFNEWFVPC